MAQQKDIMKEVKRHVQLNHQHDSNTTDKITQKGKKNKWWNGGSENLVLWNERKEYFNNNFQSF